MRVALLVPRRDDHGHRDRLWAACKARWQALHPAWDISEGYHTDGPFNRSAAINTAASQAGEWDIGVVIDSDILLHPEQAEAAVRTAYDTGRVTWGHREWWGLGNRPTHELLRHPDRLLVPDFVPDEAGMIKNPISWSCFIAIPRKAWEVIGGFDERFRGWGWEDMAFQALARGLADGGRKPESRMDGPVYHLFHPRSPGLGRATPGVDGVLSERLGRRYMVAMRRDYNIHDRPTKVVAHEDLTQDIENLRHDDAKLNRRARQLGLPDWSDWWPTLEELCAHQGPPSSVALVVHSGGSADVWPVRRGYLERSLASLGEMVDYPFERKVIYSDWPDGTDIEELAQAHGFSVEGKGNLGYTKSMQALWQYIREQPSSHVFLTEDDFTFDREVDIAQMVEVLDGNPHLVQISLLRNPVFEPETKPGTILGHPTAAFTLRNGGPVAWLEHTRYFTVNPTLISRALCNRPWPATQHSEAVYGRQILRKGQHHAAIWGKGEQWVTHIGAERTGGPY